MCLFAHAEALGEVKIPLEETRLGVADVERILHEYWRTPGTRAKLEQYRTSEEFRQKQRELANLEREFAGRRFAFFQRSEANREIREKRGELQALAEKEAERAREREREAVEKLMADIRRKAKEIGDKKQLTAIFDINTPHILFFAKSDNGTDIDDITESVIEDLNF